MYTQCSVTVNVKKSCGHTFASKKNATATAKQIAIRHRRYLESEFHAAVRKKCLKSIYCMKYGSTLYIGMAMV